ncbi:MAG: hypothetical protein CME62_16655 [Halobacteriovoraceae bacterium]|nr:hypothetical protein [Halobacteriovoraceae bacterium]|tara:strand:- start:16394 stop:17425 length:1032 start_codon:yes stop_codon:yes gene_type:complete
MNQLIKNDLFKTVFFVLLLFGFGIILFKFQRIVIPFGIAYVLALMIRPIQKQFYSVELHKKTIAILMLFFFVFTLTYPIARGIKTVTDEAHRIEYYIPKLELYLRKKFTSFKIEVEKRFNYEIETDPVDKLLEIGQENTQSLFIYLPQIIGSFLEWSLIIPLFLFFIIKDERKIRFSLLKIVPNSVVEKTYYLYHQFNNKFGDYIFAKFIEATIVGAIITAGLLIIDYPFAFLLGVIAGVTNILPYIGPIVGFLPALVVGLVDQNPNTTIGAMVILYLVANIIDLALVFPVLVSKIVNLHPMIVVASVIVGSQFGGVVGMLVSIPLAAFIKLLFKEVYSELYQ